MPQVGSRTSETARGSGPVALRPFLSESLPLVPGAERQDDQLGANVQDNPSVSNTKNMLICGNLVGADQARPGSAIPRVRLERKRARRGDARAWKRREGTGQFAEVWTGGAGMRVAKYSVAKRRSCPSANFFMRSTSSARSRLPVSEDFGRSRSRTVILAVIEKLPSAEQ